MARKSPLISRLQWSLSNLLILPQHATGTSGQSNAQHAVAYGLIRVESGSGRRAPQLTGQVYELTFVLLNQVTQLLL